MSNEIVLCAMHAVYVVHRSVQLCPRYFSNMAGQGSGGNVLAAIASFLIPGLGQLVQGRALRGLVMFVLTGVLWIITFGLGGWLGHLWACYDAAVWKGPTGA